MDQKKRRDYPKTLCVFTPSKNCCRPFKKVTAVKRVVVVRCVCVWGGVCGASVCVCVFRVVGGVCSN